MQHGAALGTAHQLVLSQDRFLHSPIRVLNDVHEIAKLMFVSSRTQRQIAEFDQISIAGIAWAYRDHGKVEIVTIVG